MYSVLLLIEIIKVFFMLFLLFFTQFFFFASLIGMEEAPAATSQSLVTYLQADAASNYTLLTTFPTSKKRVSGEGVTRSGSIDCLLHCVAAADDKAIEPGEMRDAKVSVGQRAYNVVVYKAREGEKVSMRAGENISKNFEEERHQPFYLKKLGLFIVWGPALIINDATRIELDKEKIFQRYCTSENPVTYCYSPFTYKVSD